MNGTQRVLVVEDHPDSRELLEEFLQAQGYEVECACNGRQALERLRCPSSPLPDLVLLDLMMPVMSGWELMQHLHQDPCLGHVPVVIVSGAGPSSPLPEGIRGAVPKPVDLDALTAKLEEVCPVH